MRDRQTSSATEAPPHYPQFHSLQQVEQQPHHRFVRKNRPEGEAWRELPSRGADINLLSNSLTSRLRRLGAARQKASATSKVPKLPPDYLDDDSDDEEEKRVDKQSRKASQPVVKPILKRTNASDVAEKYRYSPDESLKSSSPVSDHYLPNVFGDRRLSSSTGQLEKLPRAGKQSPRNEKGRQGKKKSLSNGARGGGGGGGGSGSQSFASSGPLRFVKRAGIFQPADKYAQGRQTLHGDDLPHAGNTPVDYETVTLPSRVGTPDSDSQVSGWSSTKSIRRKGLKVSWKDPSVLEEQPDRLDARTEESVSPVRQRSAATPPSEAKGFAFTKPRYHSGKSDVPSIGVRWKVPVPSVKRAPAGTANRKPAPSGGIIGAAGGGEGGAGGGEGTEGMGVRTVHINDIPGYSSPSTERTTSHTSQGSSLKSSPSRELLHPWRALYPRDVHPVTTAMEREGTSVSRTMWHVPTRKVQAPAFIEDLLQAHAHQWRPPMLYRLRGQPLGASSPNQSMQVAVRGNPSTTDTVLRFSNGMDNGTVDNDQGDSFRSC